MAEENTTTGKSSVIPFLVGGLAGAGVIAMLAPESGKFSGGDIKKSAITAGRKIFTAVEQGKDRYEKGKKAVTEAIQKSKGVYDEEKEKMADLIQSVSGLTQKGKSVYEEQKKTLKDLSLSITTTVEKGKNLYGEMKGRLGDITRSFKTTIGSGEEQKEEIADIAKPSGSRIIPIIAGTATGVVVVLVLSKKSGKGFGKDLKNGVISTGHKLFNVYEGTKAKVSDALEEGKRIIQTRRAEKQAA